jgi:hypothetical protein
MLSVLPTKLTKESSIERILQFSVIFQVQERLPAQSNPSDGPSTLKLLVSGYNKKFPKKESKFTMRTLKIQATDIFTKLKKRLGLISSKEM